LKLNDKAMMVLEDKIKLTKPSTKPISKMLTALKILGKKILIVVNTDADVLIKSAHNIERVVVKK
jgi:ribosomal protein L4